MGTTPRGLVYPGGTDDPDVPADMQALAESIESVWNNQPFCWVQHNATLNHATSGTWYTTPFDTENSDASAMHSTSSNQSRVIAPVAGLYVVHYNYSFAANATGQRAVQIRKNGAGVSTGGTGVAYKQLNSTAAGTFVDNGAAVLYMAANDYVELFTYQNSGGALASLASTAQFAYQSLALARFA